MTRNSVRTRGDIPVCPLRQSLLLVTLLCVFFCASDISANQLENATSQWTELASGLDFGEFKLPGGQATVAVLRIDPKNHDFVLCAAAQDDMSPATLKEWLKSKDLVAAINASMYLPDNSTSTGYMRSGDYVNNKRIAGRFGAFFVASPRKEGLPRAGILDRDHPNWRTTLDDYDIVIQNYRMTDSKRRILWSSGGPLYSISAVAEDGSGNILFLHCKQPLEAHKFTEGLLALPLDVKTVMYVEGGAQAGMVVETDNIKRDFGAIHPHSLLVTGNLRATLPNVLGIRPRRE